MKFRVIDKKTGKEADPYEIALHEEWAQGLVYCDMEGFAILEDGSLILLDECGNFRYCDGDRFIVDIYQEKGDEVVKPDRPHGEWKKEGDIFYHVKCSNCNFELKSPYDESNFCPNCGASMVSVNSKIENSNSKICPCIEYCKIDNSEPCRKGCSDYQKWKESEME